MVCNKTPRTSFVFLSSCDFLHTQKQKTDSIDFKKPEKVLFLPSESSIFESTKSYPGHIMTVKDVETFFHHIVLERKVNFHPDDVFEDYVSCEEGINTFTLDECAIYNRLMDESFAVCKKDDVDIYEIGLIELQTALGIKTEQQW